MLMLIYAIIQKA